MNIAIYQIDPDRDENNVAFLNYENLERFQGSAALRSEIYDKVFEGEVECGTLEEVYQMFNLDHPDGYRGRSLSVSDVVEVVGKEKSTFHFCDSIGFREVDFDPDMTEPLKEKKIKVVLCEPGKVARVAEIGTELSDLQRVVGGLIEPYYPFEEQVCIVCNDEGKLIGLELNRGLRDEHGEIYDVMAGTFLVVGLGEDSFTSLTPEQVQKYTEHFKQPEQFISLNGQIIALPVEPENPLRTAEMTLEDDYGMIDGVLNNGRKGEEQEKAQGEAHRGAPEKRPSIRERLAEAKRECGERKPPDKTQQKKPPEHDL